MRLWICGIGEVVKFTPLGLAFNVNGPSLTNTQVRLPQARTACAHCHVISQGLHAVLTRMRSARLRCITESVFPALTSR